MTQGAQRRARKPLLVNLAWAAALVMLPAVYVLAYAPIYRCSFGPDPEVGAMLYGRYRWQSAFVPVEWLHDHDQTAPLLIRWAELWGVNERMELDADGREMERIYAARP